MLGPHQADAVAPPSRFHDRRSFFDLQRERLFHIDIFARPQRIDRHPRVPVIGSRDQHRVDFLHLQQLSMVSKILTASRLPPPLFTLPPLHFPHPPTTHPTTLPD